MDPTINNPKLPSPSQTSAPYDLRQHLLLTGAVDVPPHPRQWFNPTQDAEIRALLQLKLTSIHDPYKLRQANLEQHNLNNDAIVCPMQQFAAMEIDNGGKIFSNTMMAKGKCEPIFQGSDPEILNPSSLNACLVSQSVPPVVHGDAGLWQTSWKSKNSAKESNVGPERRCSRTKLADRIHHIYSERQRRKGMNDLFSTLRSLLPTPIPKTDRCSIISEAIKYIEALKQKREELRRKKARILMSLSRYEEARSMVDSSSSSFLASDMDLKCKETDLDPALEKTRSRDLRVGVQFTGRNALVTASALEMGNVLSGIISLLLELNFEFVNASISKSDKNIIFFSVHAQAKGITKEAKKDLIDAMISFQNTLQA